MNGKENPFFPVTIDVAKQVEEEIKEFPETILEEKSRIDIGDKQLYLLLFGIQSGLYLMHEDFAEGATVAHLILKRQAEEGGGSLPTLPEGFAQVCMQDYIEGSYQEGFGLEEYLIELGENLKGQDTILYGVLDKLAGQRPGARIFKGGGAIVALAYRKYFEGKELEERFQ